MMPNGDPEGRIFLSALNSYDRFFFLRTFQFSLLLITFKCGNLPTWSHTCGLYFAVAVIHNVQFNTELSLSFVRK